MFNKFFNGEDVPEEWKKALITPIFKKANRKLRNNYRGISVMSSVARLYGRVIKQRIEGDMRESEDQNGFRVERSCIDGIFSLRMLVEKRLGRDCPVHLIFVDLQKAYDTVPLVELWNSLKSQGINLTYLNAARRFYEG